MIKALLQSIAMMLLLLCVAAPASAQTDRNKTQKDKKTTEKGSNQNQNKDRNQSTTDPTNTQNQNTDRMTQDTLTGTDRATQGTGTQGQGTQGTGTDRATQGTGTQGQGQGTTQGTGTDRATQGTGTQGQGTTQQGTSTDPDRATQGQGTTQGTGTDRATQGTGTQGQGQGTTQGTGTDRATQGTGTQGQGQGTTQGTGTDRATQGTGTQGQGTGTTGTTPRSGTPGQGVDNSVLLYGQPMYSNRSIVENAATSTQHSTLVGAIRSANLTETFSGAGPYTVFAPNNAAFDRLPSGTMDKMQRSENRSALTGVLNYHVVKGRYDFDALSAMIDRGENTLKTVAGGTLTIVKNGRHNIIVRDESGNTANIVTYDIYQSNGVVHSIDTVLMPRSSSK